ncbi:hypothetical protein Tco_1094096 [Tanacetum coccineum]|uniref:Uncharacterized protein n=1 Tax=Tanacetum coccineum TaxID=301880 RepID=A0ABQ5IEM5_9ASTR
MMGGNGGNQFRQFAGQNAGNQIGHNAGQIAGNQNGWGREGPFIHRDWSRGTKVLDGGNDDLKGGGVEKTRALGASGDTSISWVGIAWLVIGEGMVRARVVSRVVFMGLFWMGEDSFDEMSMTLVLGIFLGGYLEEELALKAIKRMIKKRIRAGIFRHNPKKSLFEEGNHDIINKFVKVHDSIMMRGANMHKEASVKHSIRKCHNIALGHTFHPFGNVVGKIERFFNGETIEHVGETSIRVILVSRETYDILTKDDFPFLEIDL